MSFASNSASDIDYIACLVEKSRTTGNDCQIYYLKASQAIDFSVDLHSRGKGEENHRVLQQLEDLNLHLRGSAGSVQSIILSRNIADQHIVQTNSRPCSSKGHLNADILHEILSFLSCRSHLGRMTLYNACLVSRAFHEAANRHLWRHPRSLTSYDRLKEFAFGAIVSSKLSESRRIENSAQHTRSIHIQEGKNSHQSRFLISEIGRLAPNVTSLSLTLASPDGRAVADIIIAFPRLNCLEVSVAPNSQHTPHDSTLSDTDDETILGPSVKQILGNLTSLCLFKCDAYWDVVKPHLSSNLVDLVISSADLFNDEDGDRYDQLTELPSLVSLEIDCPTLAPDFMAAVIGSFTKLERLTLRGESWKREQWTPDATNALVQQAMSLPVMKELWLSWSISVQTFTDLVVDSSTGLEDVRVCIADRDHSEEEVEEAITSLIQEHCESLRVVAISRESGKKISVHEQLLEALAAAPKLERVLLPIKKNPVDHVNMVSLINQVLQACPNLQWTDTLHNLIRGAQSIYTGEHLGQRRGRVYDEEYYLRLEGRRNELRQDPRDKRFGRISPYIDFWRLRDVGSLWV